MTAKRPQRPTDKTYQRVAKIIHDSKSIVLTTHRGPDGDGLGAEAALAEAIEQMGKRVHVLNSHPVPARYMFLSLAGSFQAYREDQHAHLIADTDALILLDAALPDRTGPLAGALTSFGGPTIAIDHHQYGGWAQVDLVDSKACATAELVHELVERLGVRITPSMAEALYTGLASDTQGFRTSHTTPDAHRRAARLLEMGLDMERVHKALFASWALERLRLLGEFLAGLATSAGGQLVWGVITIGELRQRGLYPDVLDGFVDQALTVEGAKVAILFFDEGDYVRLGMRSRPGVEISHLAEALGGGGHLLAAGARIPADRAAAMRRVLEEAT